MGDGKLEFNQMFISQSIWKTRLRDEVSKIISLNERGEAMENVCSLGEIIPCELKACSSLRAAVCMVKTEKKEQKELAKDSEVEGETL